MVNSKHAVAVTVERDPEIEPLLDDRPLQRPQVGRAALDVDVVAVGLVADRAHLRAEQLEGTRRQAGVRAVRAVDADAQRRQVRAEAIDDVLEVAVHRDADVVDGAPAGFVGVSCSSTQHV